MEADRLSLELPSLAWLGKDREEHEAVRSLCETIDRFGREALHPIASDCEGRLTQEALQEAKRLGLFGLSVPTDYGGLGLSLPAVCAAIETLTRHDRAMATTVGLHVGLGTRALVAFGSASLRSTWLPLLAAGD